MQMKLYEIKKQSWVKIISDNKNPIASIPTKDGDEVFFDHLDGMYSFCRNKDGHVVHLAAWTEVELVEKD
jgi:hypothetical protein